MNRLLISPAAMGFLPILVLHLVTLGYLLSLRAKSAPTWLFIGWWACLTCVAVSKVIGATLYAPLGGYVDWIGGIGFSLLSVLFLIQFAYRFPNKDGAREARVAFVGSSLIGMSVLCLLVYEATKPPIYPLYDFGQFFYGLVHSRYEQQLTSVSAFEVLLPSGYAWAMVVWLRQMRRHARRGQVAQARAARAFALLMAAVILSVVASAWEDQGLLPAGSFATVYLLTLFIGVLTYLNHSPEPTTFLVKLVGISLVTLLIILGLVNPMILRLHRDAYEQTRLAELGHIKTIIETGGSNQAQATRAIEAAHLPALYVVARPATGGLFPSTYTLLFSRVKDLDASSFIEQQDRLKEGLMQGRMRDQLAMLHENPWLTPEQVRDPAQLEHLAIPEGVAAFRGALAGPEQQYIRYSFTLDGTLYEVGYSYLDYRQMLHRQALPLVYLMVSATLFILIVFPLFFHGNLVRPLMELLSGVTRVNAGDLEVVVPVRVKDELGFLADSFNRMVHSLQTLNASLRSEIAERLQAEAEARALNVTLEQRVADRTRELSALYEVSAAASQAVSLEALLAESLARTIAAIHADAGVVHLLDDAAPAAVSLRLRAHQGLAPDFLTRLDALLVDGELAREVIERREPLLIPDVTTDPRAAGIAHPGGSKSLMVAPLQSSGQAIGVFSLIREPGLAFNLEEVALLASIADQVGVAVESDRLRQVAQQASVLAERERLARDLHDSVTQSLYGLILLTEAGQSQLESGATQVVKHTLARLDETARGTIREMRLYIHQLRPLTLEQDGLIGALHKRLAAVEGRADIQARLLADDGIHLPLPEEATLYQIAQEALNNALRHAHATTVTVHLGREGRQVILEIMDDGCGFDPESVAHGGMGLGNMRQRAEQIGGVLKITSVPGTGTRVKVSLPEATA